MTVDPGEPSTGNPRVPVNELEAAILAVLVDGLTVAEIGTGLGVSTRAMAATARTVHTVDIDRWVQLTVWPQLPGNVICHKMTATVPTVDVLFIDGDHTTSQVRADVGSVTARLLVAHDTNVEMVRDGLGDGWRFIPTEHGLGVRRDA